MSLVNLLNIEVYDNPSVFLNPFQFEITFECCAELEDDLEWKIIYVGSAESESHDQELDNIMVGPVPIGVNKFVFQAPHPDTSKIPASDAIGVTVILITCSYLSREFIRVGYYVNNHYTDEKLMEEMPLQVDWEKVARNILADQPRVTRFPICWTKEIPPTELPPVEGDPDAEPAAFEVYMDEDLADEGADVGAEEEEEELEEDDEMNLEEEVDMKVVNSSAVEMIV